MSTDSSTPGSVSRSWRVLSRGWLPFNVLVLVAYFVIAIVSVQWQRSKLMDRLIVSAGSEAAREHVQTLAAVRTVYTEEILPAALEHGLPVAQRGHVDNHSIPLPVTFTMKVGERMADSGRRGRTRLYSPYPFPWRTADGGLQDDFQKEAWERLNVNPTTPVVRTVPTDNGRTLRYAIADRMRASCIKCHNEHPDSPRRDWKEGDVRGVLEVEIPLAQAEAQSNRNLMESTALLVLLAAVGGVVVVYTMRQFTLVSADLEHRVQERTTELGAANLALQSQVAEREHAQQARQASEERLNLALKSAGVGTWNWNVGSDVILWDDYVPTLFGRDSGTLCPHFDDFIKIVHLDDQERVTRDVQRSVEEAVPYDTEYRVIWPDGSQHVLGARGKVYRDSQGQALHMTGICWDITESRQMARTLQETQERFALALEGSRDGIWDWNVATNQAFYSARWKSMLGCEDHEISNQFSEWERLVHPGDLAYAKQILEEYFTGQRPEYNVEFRMLHKSGDWRWILARGVAQRDATGTVVRMSGSHTDITERKAAEQALAAVNSQLAGVLAASTQVSIIATDVQGLITVFNTGAENLLGYSAAEMIGKQTPKLFHVRDEVLSRGAELTRELGVPVEGFEVFVAEAKRGRFDRREWTYVRQDGGQFPVSLVVTAVKNSVGEITGFLGVAEDITERKRAEERFRLVVEASPNSIVVVNRERNITLVNSQTETLFGYRRDELIGQPIEVLVPERFRPNHPAYVKGFFETPQRRAMGVGRDLFGLRKSGDEVPIELGLSPLTTTEGTFVLASIIDITERKRAEVELHRAKEAAEAANRVLDSSLKSIADGVIVADSTGKFLFWNEVAEEIIGLGMTDTPIEGWTARYGCFLPDMVTPYPPEDLPLVRTIRGEVVHEVELFIRNPKKPAGVWISVNGRPMRDDANVVQGGVVVFRDMTERKWVQETLARQAEELARSNKELEQFAYIASHDLQEPLRKVQTFGDMIATEAGSTLSAEGHDYLQRMRNAAARMQAFINDLLTYSRVASQAKPFERVNLPQITQEVLSDLEIRIQSTGGRVEVGELPDLDADPIQMRQLLQNLIGNALKFHRRGEPPVVTVQSRLIHSLPANGSGQSASPEMCEITVQDNGIGFDEKYVDRIFAPFKRLHGRGEYEGTGIGLAICHKIVERHRGTITARSVPGEGTRMIVTLPRNQAAEVNQHAQDR